RSFQRAACCSSPACNLKSTSTAAEMMKSSSVIDTFAPLAMFRKGLFVVVALAASTAAQTFEIGGQQNQQPQAPNVIPSRKAGRTQVPASITPESSDENSLRFGTSIEATREQRAADDALRHNNAPAAYAHAKRSVEMAPGDKSTWFTLGYAARLAGHLSESESAYKHGLQMSPSAAEGLSGLAQTYFRMGRVNDAKRMLLDVI